MIWLIPLAAGATGSWWVTKETATDILEANRPITGGGNINTGTVIFVVVVLLIGVFWLRKKGKVT